MTERGAALLGAYRLAGRLAKPALRLLHAHRVRRGKEDPARRGERFGIAALARPAGPLVWVHAASVGETNAVLPLIERIVTRGVNVLLTTGTLTSARIADSRLPAGAIHQFVPIDVVPVIERFLDHWRPGLAITVESEIWPATLDALRRRDVPSVVVNGRMSEGSFNGWKRLFGAERCIFSRISLCLAQSRRDAERFRALGVGHVESPGNLKFDVPPLGADEHALQALREQIGDRALWVAASTHPGEEEIIAAIHATLCVERPDLLLICVPRHPERGREVGDIFAHAGLSATRRSAGGPLTRASHVYVADTLGELGLFFRLAPIAFVGGSLVAIGGHNPIEPAQLDCAVLTGPQVRNFSGIYRVLEEAGGAIKLRDPQALQAALERLLGDTAAAETLRRNAHEVAVSGQGALVCVEKALEPSLKMLIENDAVAPPG